MSEEKEMALGRAVFDVAKNAAVVLGLEPADAVYALAKCLMIFSVSHARPGDEVNAVRAALEITKEIAKETEQIVLASSADDTGRPN